jgi:hypothetical protein
LNYKQGENFGLLLSDSYFLKAEGLSLSTMISEFFRNAVLPFSKRGKGGGIEVRRGDAMFIFEKDSWKLKGLLKYPDEVVLVVEIKFEFLSSLL